MNRNFIKRVPASLFALATSVSVFAASDTDSRIMQLEQQMKQVRTETAAGTFGAKTASARPENKGTNFDVCVDVLFWKTSVGGTDFAYTNNEGTSLPVDGEVRYNNFDFDWGFRVGVGYKFDHDHWEGMADYTYFRTNESTRSSGGPSVGIIPLRGLASWSQQSDITDTTYAYSSSKVSLDNVDLMLARHYFVSKDLCFKPRFGLKSSWITLEQEVVYEGGQIPSPSILVVEDQNKFWGIGPEAAIDTKWYLCNGFSIFGNASASLLWGYYKVTHEENLSKDTMIDNVYIKAPMHRFSPNMQLALGLAYDKYMNDRKQHITATLGWETIYYFRVNQNINMTDDAYQRFNRFSEDVSFQGVTLHLRLDF